MDRLDEDLIARFAAAVDRVSRVSQSIGQGPLNAGSSVITVNAGGIGVWIAGTCCLVMLAVNLFLAAMLIDHSRKIDDLRDYLNAIYMMAPQLKPAEPPKD